MSQNDNIASDFRNTFNLLRALHRSPSFFFSKCCWNKLTWTHGGEGTAAARNNNRRNRQHRAHATSPRNLSMWIWENFHADHWSVKNALPQEGLHFNATTSVHFNATRQSITFREVWWCQTCGFNSMKAFISFGTFILLTVKGSTETKKSHRQQYEVAPADPTEGV